MTNGIKVGDKVRVRKDAPRVYLRDWCKAVEYDVYAVDGDAAIITYGYQEIAIPLKYLVNADAEAKEPTEAEEDARIRQKEAELDEFKKAELDRILHPEKPTFEVTIDNVTMNWQRYEADLAKEVALKVANKFNDPKQAAEYAVKVAKAVVEGLKRK